MKNKSHFFNPSWLPVVKNLVHEGGYKSEIIVGAVLGLFALLILSFTVFVRTRIWHNRELYAQELDTIRRIEETCEHKPVEFKTIPGGFYVVCSIN